MIEEAENERRRRSWEVDAKEFAEGVGELPSRVTRYVGRFQP